MRQIERIALNRMLRRRGLPVQRHKFWMVVDKRHLPAIRVEEWWREHPGATVKEIARALDMTPNAVQLHAARLRQKWRRELQLYRNAIRRKM